MFRKVDDFLAAYQNLADGTTKMLRQLSDTNLNQRVGDDHRTLGQIAWHVVTTVPEMMSQTGLSLSSVDHKSLPPTLATEILAGYEKASTELRNALQANWNDDTLLQEDELYGEKWPRGKTLQILIHHEIHHVGQMTVLLRQTGGLVPGIYGPAKEEWSKFGMNEPPY